jgi:hypothetical protein
MLEVGKPLPVDVWSGSGQLLLRKGQPIVSEQHREKLHGHNACTTAEDGLAWQRAYERMVHTMLRDGVDLQTIARASMPSEIRQTDYVVGHEVRGGWLDVQEVLRGILYQGGLAINPLVRLAGLESRALALLDEDADDSLLCLFQALADESLGYCATHALLCLVVCELAARNLELPEAQRASLRSAALTMNIGMAREQDRLVRQTTPLTDWQRTLIHEHAQRSVDILQSVGVDDEDELDIVRGHHAPNLPDALPHNAVSRQLLWLADGFMAKMAARKTRPALSPLGAAKSIYLGHDGEPSTVGAAMAQGVGFYPPGSYVRLTNGEVAVVVQRGQRANTPWVVSLTDKDGIPLANYVCKDTAERGNGIVAPVNPQYVRVAVNVEKVRKARQRIAGRLGAV